MNGRRTPYTTRGIARLACVRCGKKPSRFQWQICSDNRMFRPLCAACDLKLNRMVLRWAGFPDWRQKFDRYAQEVAR